MKKVGDMVTGVILRNGLAVFRLLILMLFMSGLFCGTISATAAANPADEWVEQQTQQLPTDQVEKYWDRLMKDYGGFFPDGKTPSLMDMLLPGGDGLSFKGVMSGIGKYLWHEVLYNGKLLATIVMLSIMSLILENLQTAFEKAP